MPHHPHTVHYFFLAADAKNFTAARFQYVENGSQIQAFTTSSTEAVTIPQTSFTTPKVYQANVKEDGGSVEASDSLSVFAVQEGTDGHTVFLTNPTHAFPAAANGTVAGSEFAAGATEFRVSPSAGEGGEAGKHLTARTSRGRTEAVVVRFSTSSTATLSSISH